jgi:hypothetical protein
MKLSILTLIIAMAFTVSAGDPKEPKPVPKCTPGAQRCWPTGDPKIMSGKMETCLKFKNGDTMWFVTKSCKSCTGGDEKPVCYF